MIVSFDRYAPVASPVYSVALAHVDLCKTAKRDVPFVQFLNDDNVDRCKSSSSTEIFSLYLFTIEHWNTLYSDQCFRFLCQAFIELRSSVAINSEIHQCNSQQNTSNTSVTMYLSDCRSGHTRFVSLPRGICSLWKHSSSSHLREVTSSICLCEFHVHQRLHLTRNDVSMGRTSQSFHELHGCRKLINE